jgi:hypothetical protein
MHGSPWLLVIASIGFVAEFCAVGWFLGDVDQPKRRGLAVLKGPSRAPAK